ncbi:hypothetical protein ISCGN_011810 [Ixodes scapularis]
MGQSYGAELFPVQGDARAYRTQKLLRRQLAVSDLSISSARSRPGVLQRRRQASGSRRVDDRPSSSQAANRANNTASRTPDEKGKKRSKYKDTQRPKSEHGTVPDSATKDTEAVPHERAPDIRLETKETNNIESTPQRQSGDARAYRTQKLLRRQLAVSDLSISSARSRPGVLQRRRQASGSRRVDDKPSSSQAANRANNTAGRTPDEKGNKRSKYKDTQRPKSEHGTVPDSATKDTEAVPHERAPDIRLETKETNNIESTPQRQSGKKRSKYKDTQRPKSEHGTVPDSATKDTEAVPHERAPDIRLKTKETNNIESTPQRQSGNKRSKYKDTVRPKSEHGTVPDSATKDTEAVPHERAPDIRLETKETNNIESTPQRQSLAGTKLAQRQKRSHSRTDGAASASATRGRLPTLCRFSGFVRYTTPFSHCSLAKPTR